MINRLKPKKLIHKLFNLQNKYDLNVFLNSGRSIEVVFNDS